MTTRKNRLADLPTEDDAAERLLEQLARAHPAESRVADIVVDEVIRGRFRYCPALGWLVWDGMRWEVHEGGEEIVREAVRQYIDRKEREARAVAAEAGTTLEVILATVMGRIPEGERESLRRLKKDRQIVDDHGTEDEKSRFAEAWKAHDDAKRQADLWLSMLSKAKISSVAGLCRGMDGVLTRSSQLDQHPDLLNCTNGVVDLRTGELHPHDPDLLITKVAGGAYDPNARCPQWEKALEAVHPEVLDWFQLRMGQSFTGHTPDDDALIVSAGSGSNGKSAVMVALMRAAGDYGRPVSHKVLLQTPGQHTTELMDLRGLRFALLEETPEEGHLDTHQLKITIGTPQITARLMRRDTVTFDASHSLWVNTNYLPQVDSTDHGTWRRLKAMPWPYRFMKEHETPTAPHHRPGDRTLKPYLKNGQGVPEAVLAWVVEGAKRWYQANRISPPDPRPVVEATEQWRATTDVAFQFATERLAADPNAFITADDMAEAFSEFLASSGKRPWSRQTINLRLEESLVAAGILVDKTPVKPAKVREGDIQSMPPSLSSADWPRPSKRPVEVGKAARIWRGVRFRTTAEIGQPLTRAV